MVKDARTLKKGTTLVKDDRVIFTSSWNKNKTGKYTSHVIDNLTEKDFLKLTDFGWYNLSEKYTTVLNPNDTNFKYWLSHTTLKDFKENHIPTGRRKYKLK